MNKIFLLFFTILLLGCSSNSDESNNTNTDDSLIKPSKLFYENTLIEFYYDGNKLDELKAYINGEESSIFYNYTGDLITSTQVFNTNGDLVDDEVMTYDGDKLIEVKNYSISGELYSTYTFDYLPDGIVECKKFMADGYLVSERTIKLSPQGEVLEVDGQIVVYQENTPSPYKNIIGLDKLYFTFSPFIDSQGVLGERFLGGDILFLLPKKNVLIGRYDLSGDFNQNFNQSQQNYIFNENGFPVSFSYSYIANGSAFVTTDYSWIY